MVSWIILSSTIARWVSESESLVLPCLLDRSSLELADLSPGTEGASLGLADTGGRYPPNPEAPPGSAAGGTTGTAVILEVLVVTLGACPLGCICLPTVAGRLRRNGKVARGLMGP